MTRQQRSANALGRWTTSISGLRNSTSVPARHLSVDSVDMAQIPGLRLLLLAAQDRVDQPAAIVFRELELRHHRDERVIPEPSGSDDDDEPSDSDSDSGRLVLLLDSSSDGMTAVAAAFHMKIGGKFVGLLRLLLRDRPPRPR